MAHFWFVENIICFRLRYEVPYSEHSSFTELKEFVKFVSPVNIIPSVNNRGPESSSAMVSRLLDWSIRHQIAITHCPLPRFVIWGCIWLLLCNLVFSCYTILCCSLDNVTADVMCILWHDVIVVSITITSYQLVLVQNSFKCWFVFIK